MSSTGKCEPMPRQQNEKAAVQQHILNHLFTKRRKGSQPASVKNTAANNIKSTLPSAEEKLTRLAVEELASQAARGAVRAQAIGPNGWLPLPRTNKRFLQNTIRSVVSHNRRQTLGANGDGDRRKDDAELDAIIAAGNRRERRLLNVSDPQRYSFRKPKRTDAIDMVTRPNTKE